MEMDSACEYVLREYLDVARIRPSLEKEQKNMQLSAIIREKGNDAFAHGLFNEAILQYSKSLAMAPLRSECAAIAYANRSAALYQLKAYKECIADINRALDLPYPEAKQPKLRSRKQSALTKLTSEYSVKKENEIHNDHPVLAYGDNPEAPGISSGIGIAYNKEKGQHLVATKNIGPGDVLVVQRPYVTGLVLAKSMRNCHQCLKECLALIPCDNCTDALYCSEECRTEAHRTYHRIDCGLYGCNFSGYNFEVTRDVAKVRLKLFSILTEQGTGLRKLKKQIEEVETEKSKAPRRTGFTGNKYISNSSRAFVGLPCNENLQRSLDATYLAAGLTDLLRSETDFFESQCDVDLGAKLLQKLCLIFQRNCENIKSYGTEVSLASAVYPLTNMIQHACTSNTITYFLEDQTMVIRACQSIRPGEQIFRNYLGRYCTTLDTTNRRIFILSLKKFVCHCAACKRNYDFVFEIYPPMKFGEKLRNKLRRNPYDIASIWAVLKIVHCKLGNPSMLAEIVKTALIDVYAGNKPSILPTVYLCLGIL